MTTQLDDTRIVERGRRLFSGIRDMTPSVFNKGQWVGKVMDWAMRNEDFKIQLFRFVDVFPTLTTGSALATHIREYFGGDEHEVPPVLKWGSRGAALGGFIGGRLLRAFIGSNIRTMASLFIIGENSRTALKTLARLRKEGFATVIDVLGEATISEKEAEAYEAIYLELLEALKASQDEWVSLGAPSDRQDWGHAPRINVSVKPTALYSQIKPQDSDGAVQHILDRLARIYEKVIEANGFLCLDMESLHVKDITIEVFKQLRADERFRHYPHLGIVLQAYLRETDDDLENLLAWARGNELPVSIRLVKGAYWDYETVQAKQHGWPLRLYTHKAESDCAFERLAVRILENSDICHLACASHNLRSIAAVMEAAQTLNVPAERYEFQVLYGMAEPVRKALLREAGRVRLYCPYGKMVPGMAYLVRRLLENTANESFLRQSFADHAEITRLLESPQETLKRQRQELETPRLAATGDGLPPFRNHPPADFALAPIREAFRDALNAVRNALGRTYLLHINGEDIATNESLPSTNPAEPDMVVGGVCQAGTQEVAQAVEAAKTAFPAWRDTAPAARAKYLFKAAEVARRQEHELAAWQVFEVGKQWDQANADVAEAIDFLEYYGREMIRLAAPKRMGAAPGEVNLYSYEPKGVAAIISPWNFPLAISCGMVSAAIVTGNPVVFKPSGQSSVVGHQLVDLFREAGLPPGVFNFVPGRGSVIGDFLVDHPDISVIGFTGSVQTGCRILERAAVVHPGQRNVKKVVCEMGGKNAIIVDDDADLDQAVPGVLYSAFGYQGQKCSACSRVIVLNAVYDRFLARLLEAAQSIKMGPAEDPSNTLGPVVDGAAQASIREYIELAETEGRVAYRGEIPEQGHYVPMTIVEGIRPEHRIAQEEIFGPVLAVMRAKDFSQALEWALSTRFALTGALYSRNPSHLERARKVFRVGNLYLNRGSTGALVQRQPFGGTAMSGVGTKAGGPDYLRHFMDPRTVTEDTMRRGFTPINKDDDWVD